MPARGLTVEENVVCHKSPALFTPKFDVQGVECGNSGDVRCIVAEVDEVRSHEGDSQKKS